MAEEFRSYFSEFKKNFVTKIEKYTSNRVIVTDVLSKLVMTFGVVLIIGGLYLMLFNSGTSPESSMLAVSTLGWIPGIPFSVGDLSQRGTSVVGLASWVIGVDLLLVGLGFWVRNKLARFIGMAIFMLATIFQFIGFLYAGIIGSPSSAVGFCVNGVLVFFLFSRLI